MSGSEEDEVDLLLTYSGSEYEPSSSEDYSDLSSAPSADDNSDSGTGGTRKRQKRIRDSDRKRRKLPRQNLNRNAPNNHTDINSSSSSSHQVTYKNFIEFMQGVVFTLSGFVNPLRTELRNKALEMGAQYRPDWDSSCTHLVCAFRHTPKYDQVRGNGKIVKKEWVEDAYLSRKRFPWRRYSLDWRDSNLCESEGEIHEINTTGTLNNSVNDSNDCQ